MREIKFRGKRKDNGKWVIGFYARDRDYGPEHFEYRDCIIITKKGSEEGMWAEVDPETVGQYTGFHDKNGNAIFEGDILEVTNPDWERDKDCLVKWDDDATGYTYEPIEGYGEFDISTIGWAREMDFSFEVVGNIHDHPHLLEVEK